MTVWFHDSLRFELCSPLHVYKMGGIALFDLGTAALAEPQGDHWLSALTVLLFGPPLLIVTERRLQSRFAANDRISRITMDSLERLN